MGPLAQLVEHFPFKEGVVGSESNRAHQIKVIIGGYSIIILLIQLFKFSILFLLEGCVLKNCGGSLPFFASDILSQNLTDSFMLKPERDEK